jgi:hypothetical protein
MMQPSRGKKTKVILVSTLAAIAYGIIHDQITAHLCVEYFTIAHPPLFHTESPTILAFCWGVLATVGIGVVLGVLLAAVSQSEGLPPYPILHLGRSILSLLVAMALMAFLAGVLGFELSLHSLISLPIGFAELISPARRDRFMAVWFAHGASYLTGLTGGTLLILRIWNQRGKPPVLALIPRTKPAIVRALIVVALAVLILFIRFACS